MAVDCLVCDEEVDDELICTHSPDHQLHYLCGYGAELNNNTWRTYFKKGNYICPVCIVGRNNDLVLKAVSSNQRHIRACNTDTDTSSVVSAEEPVEEEVQSEVEEVQSEVEEEVSTLDNSASSVNDWYASSSLCLGGENFLNALHGSPPHPQPCPPRRSAHKVQSSDPTVPLGRSPQRQMSGGFEVGGVQFAPPHPSDKSRADKPFFILKSLRNLPSHVTTVVLGDSNTHHVKASQVDPKGNSVAVRSFSGLCIPAAVIAMNRYKNFPYKKCRKIVWSLGVNDALHGEQQHCTEDYPNYVRALYTETKRIFPNAAVHFILPFLGVKDVTLAYRKNLAQTLKAQCPKVIVHKPPSMEGMLAPDGVHISEAGRSTYTNFLMKRFTNSSPTSAVKAEPQGHIVTAGSASATKVNPSKPDPVIPPSYGFLPLPDSGPMMPNARSYPQYTQPRDPAFSGFTNGLVDLLTRCLQNRPETHQYRYNSVQQWPPIPPY